MSKMSIAAHGHSRFYTDHGIERAMSAVASVFGLPYRVLTTLRMWQARSAYRVRLMALDDHMLNDIGLAPGDMEHEARKPFWMV